ncbi:MAG: hypothetical protein ACMUIP_06300 [bacterium]
MNEIVCTTNKDWLEQAIKLYTDKKPFTFEDDAKLGLTEADLKSAVALIRAAKAKGGIHWQQIVRVLAGIGITGVGVWMVAAAIADPEPTTKLGLLITGGIVLAFTGSLGTFAALGLRFSVSAKSPRGHSFEIKPE